MFLNDSNLATFSLTFSISSIFSVAYLVMIFDILIEKR